MKHKSHEFKETYFERAVSHYRTYKNMKLMEKAYFPKSILDENIPPNSRVLDVGCAFGYFLKLCAEYKLETYGLDISEYAIEKAKAITKAKLYLHDVNDGLQFFQNEFFDLVTMFDIIEHVKSPYNLLMEVRRVLKRGAKMVITTPNVNAIAKFLKGNQWVGFSDPTHLYLFTSDSLKFLVEKNGFIVTKLETLFHPFPKFLQKILNRTGKGGEIWLVGRKI